MTYEWDFSLLVQNWPVLLRGLLVTVELWIPAMAAGLALGFLLGLLEECGYMRKLVGLETRADDRGERERVKLFLLQRGVEVRRGALRESAVGGGAVGQVFGAARCAGRREDGHGVGHLGRGKVSVGGVVAAGIGHAAGEGGGQQDGEAGWDLLHDASPVA